MAKKYDCYIEVVNREKHTIERKYLQKNLTFAEKVQIRKMNPRKPGIHFEEVRG